MKRISMLAGILAVSACAQTPDVISLDQIRDPRGALPGFDAVINCDRGPRILYDKFGEIVETIQPIRHPACPDRNAQLASLERKDNMFVLPPKEFLNNEATDDDQPRDTAALPKPTPPKDAAPTDPKDKNPTDHKDLSPTDENNNPPTDKESPPDPNAGCNGAPHCEPDSKTDPDAYRIWLIDFQKRNKAKSVASDYSFF